jgi:hypothetical protein
MDYLGTILASYIESEEYVYKSCYNYIVVLLKLADTKTNESRSKITNPLYAKYRANKLKVIAIVHKFDPTKLITEVENSSYERNKVIYKVGKILEISDYDDDLENVCSTGIHYFKTVEPAFYYDLEKYYPTYTGHFIH